MREKLIDLLEDICEKYAPCEMDVVADHLIQNGVTFAKDNNVPSWIPVTERLPELHEMQLKDDDSVYVTHVSNRVLAYTEDGDHVLVYREIWAGKEDWVEEGGSTHIVTHWMPIPEPPKEVE